MKRQFCFALIAILCCPIAHAVTIVNYDNTSNSIGYDSSVPHAAAYADSLVNASAISITGVQGVNHIEAYQTNGWSAAATPDLSKYVTFSLTPLAGYELSFESFEIDLWQSLGQQGVRQFSLRSSADAFSSDIFASAIQVVPMNPVNSHYSFSLSSLGSTASQMDFRLYFYDVAVPGQNFSLISMGNLGNGISINGSVAPSNPTSAPEPSTLVLASIGFLMAGFVKRRQRAF